MARKRKPIDDGAECEGWGYAADGTYIAARGTCETVERVLEGCPMTIITLLRAISMADFEAAMAAQDRDAT